MQFKALPNPAKVLLALVVGASLSGVVHLIEPRLTLIYLIGFVAIILLYLLYLWIVARMKKRQASGFGSQLDATNTQAPSNLNDPAKRARLDDLRRNFEKGVGRYRTAGKDLYSLPWLLVVGEPGSGKTEAIRHSNVGFPPGLQDELQGVGGTINMNWWFTNRAVILDTAGRLMFEEVEAGATSEWREFLVLLRKTRGNCPINGMLLVIPVDTLIKDTTEQITRKASKIAQQLDLIQRTLDVRFPVFVVITKCDLINGFREFFDNLTDPQLQHQILGWSNPTPLDEPFRPEEVEKHLESVAESLSKRRLALLRDPIPERAGGRRADEVDAFYSLPPSLTALAPRLRRYLETIFVAGEWSAKPLFLRGIYFSSAMREGSALDLELAQAIGVSVESLPDGKAWERERAYFLRDLFLDKIFRERGLVTRASNTRTLLRRRRLIVLGSIAVSLLLVFGFSLLGYRSLYQSVGKESAIWQPTTAGWENEAWNPIVTPELKGSTNYTYNGAQPIRVGSNMVPLAQFHEQLASITRKDIDVPLIFLPMAKVIADLNPERRAAQKKLFEASVLAPLVEAARAKMQNDKGPWTPAATQALSVLIRIEGMLNNPDAALTADDVSTETFFLPLLNYVAPKNADVATLGATFEATYIANADDRKKFPPKNLSAGPNLVKNRALATGLQRFFTQAQADQQSLERGFELIRSLRTELRGYRRAEEDLARVTGSIPDPGMLARDSEPILSRLMDARGSTESVIKKLVATGYVDENFASLLEAYKGLTAKARASTESAFKGLQSENNRFPVPATPAKNSEYTLPAEISRLLRSNLQDLRDRTESTFSEQEEQELRLLDELYVMKTRDGGRLYETRASIYRRAAYPLTLPTGENATVIGVVDSSIESIRANLALADGQAKTLEGREAARTQSIARSLVAAGEYHAFDLLISRYDSDFRALGAQNSRFPLIAAKGSDKNLTRDQVRKLGATLKGAAKDMAVLSAATVPKALRPAADALPTRILPVASIFDVLSPLADGQPATVSIRLVQFADQKKFMAQRLNTEEFAPKFAGYIWRTMRIAGGNRQRSEAPADFDLGKFPIERDSFTIDFFRGVDDPAPDKTFNLASEYAVLRLLHQSYAKRRSGGKEWEIMLPITDEVGRERYLFLVLVFEKALPEIADWPTAASLAAKATP